MPAIISHAETETGLRRILMSEGYVLSPERAHGETGCDVIAQKGHCRIHIEVIGYKTTGPARAKVFFESFFRAISRIKDGASKCIIAVPKNAEQGLPARARQYGEAWTRIGIAFPELEIWLVDVANNSYQRTPWNGWLK
jgi:hypothetical protein